ncbi:hypothetical protein N8000_07370 [Rhodospirillales bacterium]|nr:hypothetical protein [Rhodospirillales bacterium]
MPFQAPTVLLTVISPLASKLRYLLALVAVIGSSTVLSPSVTGRRTERPCAVSNSLNSETILSNSSFISEALNTPFVEKLVVRSTVRLLVIVIIAPLVGAEPNTTLPPLSLPTPVTL